MENFHFVQATNLQLFRSLKHPSATSRDVPQLHLHQPKPTLHRADPPEGQEFEQQLLQQNPYLQVYMICHVSKISICKSTLGILFDSLMLLMISHFEQQLFPKANYCKDPKNIAG